ncbi:cytochrome c oxidase assembly factor 3, mitochondrial [Tribolium castaneum]|uniref:cytochrome c oxidase assembly factor 3, mitochondrial n=1 Tax=Tribolium castaneum TaxID=7070 RepID=UPI00046C3376|nr:PREDICTED: cytochrome c oxidase assembly factor 3, mitochondrial [Tribolium castaneum]|eukprot:XP_008200280.1 PREDICTED: cytochrome c oxidase assembly factor 3, mitochondrial [Tribolium castaneum]
MSESDRMPKIDRTKLKQTDIDFIKFVEKQNLDRVRKLQTLRRKNLITVSLLGTAVLGIYGYSIWAVRQENFLDDFEIPTTVTESAK